MSAGASQTPGGGGPTPDFVPAETDGQPPVDFHSLAAEVFGAQFETACRYAAHLTDVGAIRGIIGPREVPRLWGRHLLNCASVSELIPPGARVVDIGSGGGLPGIPIALRRPDLRVTLLDSALRRVDYLTEVVQELGLGNRIIVIRARAEEHRGRYDVVTARAVAALPQLGRWTRTLTETGGLLLAIRGEQAAAELLAAREDLGKVGWSGSSVVVCGHTKAPATVVTANRR